MTAKKRAKRRCRSCGSKLGKRATMCRSCGTVGGPGALQSVKSMRKVLAKQARQAQPAPRAVYGTAPAYITKSAASPLRTACIHGCRGTWSGNCCGECGSLLPGRQMHPAVAKSSLDSGDYWLRTMMRSSDPGERELIRSMHLTPAITKGAGMYGMNPGDAAALLREFYAESDPARRNHLWEILHPSAEGGDAA
jgi:hypothetical protein